MSPVSTRSFQTFAETSRKCKPDRRMVSIEHKEKSKIRSLLPDAGRLSPPVEQHLNTLGIAVIPLLGFHFGT